MKKLFMPILLATIFLFTACSFKNASDNTEADSDIDINPEKKVVAQAQIETKVEEFEEEKYTFAPADLVCYLPEDFVESDYPGEFVPKNHKNDVSSINHIITDTTDDLTTMSKEEFVSTVEAEYYESYGEEVKVNMTQYDKIMVDGRPGLWVMYNFDFRSEHFEVLTVLLFNGTELHNITYFQDTDASWMEEYIESAKSIGFENK